jgi:hypothetical protein
MQSEQTTTFYRAFEMLKGLIKLKEAKKQGTFASHCFILPNLREGNTIDT